MVTGNNAIFRYKTVKGPLHRIPPVLKLLLLPLLSILCMPLPLSALIAGIITAAIASLICGITFHEQLTDFKPAFFYMVLMYALSIFSALFEKRDPLPPGDLVLLLCTPRPDFLLLVMRLFLIVQLSALLFRTTTTLEIRNGLSLIEICIRRFLWLIFFRQNKDSKSGSPVIKPRFAQIIALFAGFIPELFETWNQIDTAWRARGGKNGLKKIRTLVYVLISLSMDKAARKARAIAAREGAVSS